MFYDDSFSTLKDSEIIENRSPFGAGISIDKSNTMITNCLIANNSGMESDWGGSWGGGISIEESNIQINNCTINNNMADNGGGIYSLSSWFYLKNMLIDGNKAENSYKAGKGGGFFIEDSHIYLINSLIVSNSADDGSIVCCQKNSFQSFIFSTIACNSPEKSGDFFASSDSTNKILNSILWDNGEDQFSGPVIIENSDIEGGYQGEGNINKDPCFVSGPRGDYYLGCLSAGQDCDSPCINTGNKDSWFKYIQESTTRTDGIMDKGDVDMGYHYPLHIQFKLYRSPNKLRFYNGDNVKILLDLETAPGTFNTDIYLYMVDPDGNFWSGADWSEGLNPILSNYSIPGNLLLKNATLLTLSIPEDSPRIKNPGDYTFYLGATLPESDEFISNLEKLSVTFYEGEMQ